MSVRTDRSGAPPSYCAREISKEERGLSELRGKSYLAGDCTDMGRAFATADLERPTGSLISNPDGRRKVSIDGRAELERLEIRSDDRRGLASGFRLDIGGDGALSSAFQG